jgi:hypothetical protein
MSEERYIVTMKPEGAGPPGIIRLRRALKCLLRSFGLRAIDVREVSNGAAADAGKGPEVKS